LGKAFGCRLSEAMDRHKVGVVALSIAVAGVGVLLAQGMRVRPDFADLLPPSAVSVRQLREVQRRAQVSGTVLIGIEGEPAARARVASVLEGELAALDREGISEIRIDDHVIRQFVWEHRFLYTPLNELQRARDALQRKRAEQNPFFVPLDEDKPADTRQEIQRLHDRMEEARQKAAAPSPRVSNDGRLQLVTIRTTFPSDDSDSGKRLVDQLDHMLARSRAAAPGVQTGLTGDVVGTVTQQRGLLNGMLIAVGLTVGLVFAALVYFYRSLPAVLALLWALAVGSLATFGFARLAIGQLNLASAFLSSIVVGNGINAGIIFLARHFEERRRGLLGLDALAIAVSATIPATLVATATAAVAYGSLSITQFRGFRDFGLIGGVGMILCWLSTYTVLPALLAGCERRGWIRPRPAPAIGRLLERLVPRRPRLVSWMAIGVFAVMGAIVARFLVLGPLETNLRNIRSVGPQFATQDEWTRKIDRAFGSGLSGGFVIAAPSLASAREVTRRLRQVDEGKPERARLLSRVSDIDDLLPADQPEKLRVLADIRRLSQGKAIEALSPDDRKLLDDLRPPENLRPLTAYDLPTQMAWPFTEKNGTRGRLVLANTGDGVDTWNLNDLRRFAAAVRGLQLDGDVQVGGPAFIFSDMLDAMYRDGPRATVATAIGSTLIVLLLGVRRYAGPTLFCGALGTLSMVALASLMGLKINFLDFVALPITIGVGIDYAVNIAARARQGTNAGVVIGATGSAVLLASYTTTVGYGSLLLSRNRGIHSFGLAAMLGELTCLSVALIVAPALLQRDTQPRGDERI
jgi:predicted RND superfamily exporter protein